MERLQEFELDGIHVFHITFSKLDEAEGIKLLKDVTLKQKQCNVPYCLISDVRDFFITTIVSQEAKKSANTNKQRSNFLGAATIGITGVKKFLMSVIDRDNYIAGSVDDAKEWIKNRNK